MGNTASNSNLPPQSQPGSALQLCLNGVFAGNHGAVSYPQDWFYQQRAVRPYNTDWPITPAAVVRPTTAEEVAEVVRCAVQSSVKVQPRSGGHSYANYCLGGVDGAVVVDLVNFQQFSMDKTTWHATIGAGTLLGDVTQRLHAAGGRAIAHGTCPQVGIGGHATIGGLGPLSRQWGSALDHVIEAQVVLANSTIIRASSTSYPDVFFAMKGAGASFGIITEFVVLTHPEPGSMVQYSYNISFSKHINLVDTFSTWQTLISDPTLDRRLASQVIVFKYGMLITGTFFGTRQEFEQLRFSQTFAPSTSTTVSVVDSWLDLFDSWAETEATALVGGISGAFYSKSLAFRDNTLIPRSGIEDLFAFFDTDAGTPIWFVIFDLEAGATNDVPQSATAYAHRDALFYLQSYAVGYPHVSNATRAWLNGINQIVQTSLSNIDLGAYAGYVDPYLTNPQKEYWGTNLPRLQQIKKAIDPLDVFHNPESVRPA